MQISFKDGCCFAGDLGPFPTPWAAYSAASLLAMDDGESVRQYDRDGRLHVRVAPISKANICEYYGREIPAFDKLGLDPEKKYKLYRHPEELKKAADTFNNLPLLLRHVPLTAATHQPSLTVGTTGTEARYEHPYLKNNISVWSDDGIGGIEDETQRELSSSYHYRADMSPGVTPEGEAYDGVMRDIVGNHVALVREGRAGDDVVVGDSKPIEEFVMSKTVLSRKASTARGALIAYLAPKLAMDAKLDVTPFFVGVTSKNFSTKKPAIIKSVTDAVQGKLAADAKIEDFHKLLDSLEKDEVAEGADADPETGEPLEGEALKKLLGEPAKAAEDEDEEANNKRREFLTSKLSAEDMKAYDALDVRGGTQTAVDSDPEKAENENMVTKPAMDEAIAKATAETEKKVRETFKATRLAEQAVEPYVGKLSMAFDSAPDVYRAAFKMMDVDVTGVDASAYNAILKAQPLPGAKKTNGERRLAMDAKSVSSFNERYPDASRIGAA
jgi:hypothetical protein